MKTEVLLDTGPLVAYLKKRDRYHQWSLQQWEQITPPLLTCEAVIVETCFLLRSTYGGVEKLMGLLRTDIICIEFNLKEEVTTIDELMQRYQSVPMSLADACLVRMAELNPNSEILTLDRDFLIYRKFRNNPISLIIPN